MLVFIVFRFTLTVYISYWYEIDNKINDDDDADDQEAHL